MLIGPDGQKRPTDVIANAVHAAKITTRGAEDEYVDLGKSAGGRKSGEARAASMTPEERREQTRKGAAARWAGRKDG